MFSLLQVTNMDDKYASKLSPTVDFWAGIYLVIIAFLSIVGNAAVLVSAGRRLALLKAPEFLTVNLALTDIGMAVSMYPLSSASAFNHAWIGGDPTCLYYGLMGMIFSVTSIMTLAVMGMVRFLVTGSPPKKGITFQRRTISIVICGIWLYAGLWALFPLLGWGSYGPEPFGLACSIDWTGYGESLNHATFIMFLSVLCTILPCLVILFTYFGIAWKLHRAYQSIQSNDFQNSNIEKKITLMAVMISLGFLVAWSPYVAVSFWSMFHSREQGRMTPFISLLPCLFAKSSTVYNPFIYFIFQRTSAPRLLLFKRCVCCRHHAAGSSGVGAETGGSLTKTCAGTDETYACVIGVGVSQLEGKKTTLG
ncbi:opsin 8, group member a [Mugil cephalus]|uniref:opsin 8, group member a n=1 Tax=Mugil cephalus TaxID=48193 RepID=UPI001FB8250B|nr:opsin 8, group member a [Mugil cephalus]